MNKPRIFIPVESKKREFDGKLLLAVHLVKNGFEVFVGRKTHIRHELMNSKNGIYLAKSSSIANLEFYKELRKRGHRLLVLDVEGIALTKIIENDLVRSYQSEIIDYFDYFLTFGEKLKEEMIKYIPKLTDDNVFVSGGPRFDLLKPKYHEFFAKETYNIQEKYHNFILINTSFGLSNPLSGMKFTLNKLTTSADIPDDQRHQYLKRVKDGKKLIKHFINATIYLAEQNPEMNFVLRPHPGEKLKIYEDSFANYGNIFVNNKENVHCWILAAKAVIHYDCTTGIESVLAGKPTISFAPFEDDLITAWLPIYVSEKVMNKEKLNAKIQNLQRHNFENIYALCDERKALLESYSINYVDFASERIAVFMKEHYADMYFFETNKLRLTYLRYKNDLKFIKKIIIRNEYFPPLISRKYINAKFSTLVDIIEMKKIKYKIIGSEMIKIYR